VRIRNHLIAQYFPEMDSCFSYGQGSALLRWCLDPKTLLNCLLRNLFSWYPLITGGEKQRQRLAEIHRKAASSIGCELTQSVSFEAKTLLKEMHELHKAIQKTDKKIAEVCRRFPEYPCLLSIPGFGPDISTKVIGALGNSCRFENHRQVLKTAGLDFSADTSGKRNATAPVISKKGKADLRYGLYQAALIASTRDRAFATYVTNRLKGRQREKGIRTRMRAKLGAKMLVIAWTLIKNI